MKSMRTFNFLSLLLFAGLATTGAGYDFDASGGAGSAAYHCTWNVDGGTWVAAQNYWTYTVTASATQTSGGAYWASGVGATWSNGGATIGISSPGGNLGTPNPNSGVFALAPGASMTVKGGVGTAGGTVFYGPQVTIVAPPAPPPPPPPPTPQPQVQDATQTTANSVMVESTCPPQGMAVANAHAMVCSLNITDMPLSYSPPFGPAIDFTLTYNQRETSQPATLDYSNLGPKWLHNWMSFVDEIVWAPPAGQSLTVLTPYVRLPGGGTDTYPNSAPFTWGGTITMPCTFTSMSDSHVQLVKSSTGYVQNNPDGSKLVYGFSASVGGTANVWTRYFLTQAVDRFGNAVTAAYDSSKRITSLTDASGRVTSFAYESTDPLKITKVTDPFGRYCTITYFADGHLKKITDAIGLTSEFTYQGDFINSMITPYGTSAFAYGESGSDRWLTLTDPQGGVARVEYHAQIANFTSLISLGTKPAGLVTGSTSDDTFHLTLYWNKKAMSDAPNPASPSLASAHVFHWLRGNSGSTSGSLQYEKQALENRVYYNYEGQVAPGDYEGSSRRRVAAGRVLDDGTTQLSTFQYDSFGNLTRAIDPASRQTDFVYHANGLDLLEVRQKTGASSYDVMSKFTYTPPHLPLTATDAAGQVNNFTYNSAGQLRTITNAKSETTTLWYHSTGQSASPPLDSAATGYLVQVDGAIAGATTKIQYDTAGRPATVADSTGYAVSTQYDDFDRVTRVTYPDSTDEQITYNRLDTASLRDRRGRITQTSYDSLRHLEKVIDPLGRITQYDWCTCGAPFSLIDPEGRTTFFDYDVQGRLWRKRFPDSSSLVYAYETTTSRLKSATDTKAQVANYQYFVDNALKQVSYTGAVIATPTVSFTYDPNYPRVASMVHGTDTTSYTYNPIPVAPTLGAGRLASVDGPLANDTITYAYDQLGRVLNRSINGAANASSVVYDALGRLTSATNPLGTFGYNYVSTTGRLDYVTYPNGQRTNYGFFNNAGDQRLQQIQNLKTTGGPNLSTFGYTYDAEGVIQTWTKQLDTATTLSSAFKYDAADQLTEAAVPSTPSAVKNFVYRYGKAGNRSSEQIDNAVTSATHNNLNQVTALAPTGPIRVEGTVNEPANVTVSGVTATTGAGNTFKADVVLAPGAQNISVVATDGSGNTATKNYQLSVDNGTTRSLTYDATGNLTNDGTGKTYGWDAANRLVTITQGANVTEFVYDGLGRRVKEKLNSTVIKQWVWCDGAQPCEERDASNTVMKRFYGQGEQISGTAYFYTFDHLGSIREMTDSSGTVRARYDYDPYGRTTKVSGDLEADFGFTGFYRHQASGLSLTLFRAYDPILGRWLSRDPIGEEGGINLYGYVSNNPINAIDPLGLTESFTFVLNGKPMSALQAAGGASYPAFSGLGSAVNSPAQVGKANVGPIPTGTYYIVDRPSGGILGSVRDWWSGKDVWFGLFRDDGTIDDKTLVSGVTRGEFRLHPKGPLGISQGCVTLEKKKDFDAVRTMLLKTTKGTIPGTKIPYYGTIKVK